MGNSFLRSFGFRAALQRSVKRNRVCRTLRSRPTPVPSPPTRCGARPTSARTGGCRGGGRRRSRDPVFFPECSISWQQIMKKYRRRACNSAKYDRMKTEQQTGSGFRRPLPPAPAPAQKTTDGAGRRGVPCARVRARAHTSAIRRANRAGANAPARPRAIARGIVGPPRRAAGRWENGAKTDREERPMPETGRNSRSAGPGRPQQARSGRAMRTPHMTKHDIP